MKYQLNPKKRKVKSLLTTIFIVLALILILTQTNIVHALPTGVTITSNRTEQANETPAAAITTAGGTFTTLTLNGTFQNSKWKAYVGNVTGILTLDDSTGYTIYDWNLTSISGEVYVSRNSTITWSNVNCSNTSRIATEQQFFSMNDSSIDSINRTFNSTTHRGFYVGTRQIVHSSCRSISTYVNDTRQSISENSKFQEVLLTDNINSIYAVILEDNTAGYNNGKYNFQMIVPEDDTKTIPTTYYFYAELS